MSHRLRCSGHFQIALSLLLLGFELFAAGTAHPTDSEHAIRIQRVVEEIAVDGNLDDPGWKSAEPLTTWYETNPGDNVEPRVRNIAYLAYDDRFLYAAFELEDPEPARIRAPLGNRDHVPGYTDYAGVIIDATNDGRTAQMFLANPRGIQYDAISSDAAGEDSAPDFYWDSAARITAEGWVLELRIPFSSLRYTSRNPEQWGILLYRNHPREFRYQIFSSRLPRDSNCFICNVRPLVGLENLPAGSHWVVAPYVNARQVALPSGQLGAPLGNRSERTELGLDAKWQPSPATVIDATVNPDFSQVEADVAQIAANERFALFFPETRPFFLEAVDLFSTPIAAVFTRSFSDPTWGARATGAAGGHSYTLLLGEDEGGGSVILPGATGSSLVRQDFSSHVALARWRKDLGPSFVSALFTGREIEGGGHNRVLGPDFRFKPTGSDTVTGQFLWSDTETPNRPGLERQWDGRSLSGHALELQWNRVTTTWDYTSVYSDVDEDFRADNGFVPQVGYRRGFAEVGRTWRPVEKPITRLRAFTFASRSEDRDGELLGQSITPGFGFDSLLSSFVRVELAFDELRAIEQTFRRNQIRTTIDLRPSRIFSLVRLSAVLGDEVDFANDRLGDGTTLRLAADVRPSDHLVLSLNADRRWLDVDLEDGHSGRLFTADVGRLRATYTFTARTWLRLIAQWIETERAPELYTFDVDSSDSTFNGSLVFAYKLNWQTVLYAGWGDNRLADDLDTLQKSDRQLFLKIAYAFRG
jgi:hypothetical protein